jgi:hypothetical protein
MPLKTAMPIDLRALAPAPVAMTSGGTEDDYQPPVASIGLTRVPQTDPIGPDVARPQKIKTWPQET